MPQPQLVTFYRIVNLELKTPSDHKAVNVLNNTASQLAGIPTALRASGHAYKLQSIID